MDYDKRNALLAKVGDLSDDNNLNTYVSLEDFFVGNDDPGSLWPNLEQPAETTAEAFAFLQAIRSRPDVRDVLICIYDFDDEEGVWFFAERIVVITDATAATVTAWFDQFPPDDCFGADEDAMVASLASQGIASMALWWD